MANNRTGRYISMILRHKPEVIGITLDEHVLCVHNTYCNTAINA